MELARQKVNAARLAALLLAIGLGLALTLTVAGDGEAKRTTVKKVTKPAWLPRMLVTEYYPAREAWFAGKKIPTPGIPGHKSRIDWLYSAVGMSMEGDGLGIDGKRYHIDNLGKGGWVGRDGKKASWGSSDKKRTPFWRSSGFWRNSKRAVTFQLEDGSWYNGEGKKWVPQRGITFARGPSLPLRYYRSVATDTSFIPRGSLVWIGRYTDNNGDGWFRADDTGGAIDGRHIDVYRKPPKSVGEGGSYKNERLYVVPKAAIADYIERETEQDRDGLPLPPKTLY